VRAAPPPVARCGHHRTENPLKGLFLMTEATETFEVKASAGAFAGEAADRYAELATAFETFKATNEQRIAPIGRRGAAEPGTEDKPPPPHRRNRHRQVGARPQGGGAGAAPPRDRRYPPDRRRRIQGRLLRLREARRGEGAVDRLQSRRRLSGPRRD